jgi:hypothetical protein
MAWTQHERGKKDAPYVYQPFPKHVTHVSGDQPFKVVNSEAEWAALGPEWGYIAPETAIEAVTEAPIDDAEPPKRGRKARA